jgi:hypothetical protein
VPVLLPASEDVRLAERETVAEPELPGVVVALPPLGLTVPDALTVDVGEPLMLTVALPPVGETLTVAELLREPEGVALPPLGETLCVVVGEPERLAVSEREFVPLPLCVALPVGVVVDETLAVAEALTVEEPLAETVVVGEAVPLAVVETESELEGEGEIVVEPVPDIVIVDVGELERVGLVVHGAEGDALPPVGEPLGDALPPLGVSEPLGETLPLPLTVCVGDVVPLREGLPLTEREIVDDALAE